MSKKILLFGEVHGSYRSQTLIKGLLDLGYKIAIVNKSFFCSNHQGRRLYHKVYRRFFSYMARILFCLDCFGKVPFCNTIYVMAMNPKFVPYAVFFKSLFRKRLVSELYISIYDTARDRGWIQDPHSFKARYYRFLDRLLLEHSDVVIHVSQKEIDYVARLVNARPEKMGQIEICPLAIDEKIFATPIPSKTFRVCWWGTFIPLHGLDHILEAFTLLPQIAPDIKFSLDLFGLPGKQAEIYQDKIKKMGLGATTTLHTKETFANGLLEEYLAHSCDLALGNFGDSEKARIVFCNKIGDAFAMKIPVLSMETPGLTEFVTPNKELFVCSNNPANIAQSIVYIQAHPEEACQKADAGYAVYRNTFHPSRYIRSVDRILHKI